MQGRGGGGQCVCDNTLEPGMKNLSNAQLTDYRLPSDNPGVGDWLEAMC